MATTMYVRYDQPEVEPPIQNEEGLTQEIISLINSTQHKNFSMHRHYMRGTHVKTQAIVKGTLTILPDLPEELAQGIASPQNAREPHPIAIRYANEPSWLQDDRAPGPRGCGIKIFNVHGGDDGGFLDPAGEATHTHDMTFNNAPILELRDLPTTVEIFRIRDRHFREPEKIPDELEKRTDRDLQMAPQQLPNHHFLAYTMYSQSAYRWGPYVAKYALFPTGDVQSKLADQHTVTSSSDPEQHSTWLRDFFNSDKDDATYDLRVQLCQDLNAQPVEDTSIEWSETQFPFVTIGHVVIPSAAGGNGINSDPMSPSRRLAWDEGMYLSVWEGLAAHRPLGSANRLRRALYGASRGVRERGNGNGKKMGGVKSVDEIP